MNTVSPFQLPLAVLCLAVKITSVSFVCVFRMLYKIWCAYVGTFLSSSLSPVGKYLVPPPAFELSAFVCVLEG